MSTCWHLQYLAAFFNGAGPVLQEWHRCPSKQYGGGRALLNIHKVSVLFQSVVHFCVGKENFCVVILHMIWTAGIICQLCFIYAGSSWCCRHKASWCEGPQPVQCSWGISSFWWSFLLSYLLSPCCAAVLRQALQNDWCSAPPPLHGILRNLCRHCSFNMSCPQHLWICSWQNLCWLSY